jgi:hypothetical protein
MGPGETIGLIAVVVLLITVLGMIYSAYERRLKFKERQLELEAGKASSGDGASARTIAELEKRVRVLERIATDRGHDVAAQIEALRDQRMVEKTDAGVPLAMVRKEIV